MTTVAIKTYTGNFVLPCPSGLFSDPAFLIQSAARVFVIKNLIWSFTIRDDVTGLIIPPEENTVIWIYLQIGRAAVNVPSVRIFEVFAPPAPDPADRSIRLYKAGQYSFENVEFVNETLITVMAHNSDVANDYNVFVNVTAEIEERGGFG